MDTKWIAFVASNHNLSPKPTDECTNRCFLPSLRSGLDSDSFNGWLSEFSVFRSGQAPSVGFPTEWLAEGLNPRRQNIRGFVKCVGV